MKHKQKHEIAPAGHPASALGERAIFLFAVVCMVVGVAIGYMLRGIMSPEVTAPATQAVTAPAAANEAPQVSLGSAVEPVEAALEEDPKNTKLLIQLGNLYYDHHVYTKATAYYQRALQLDPRNVNVRTDLGTAFANSGFPKQAVAEYQKVLAIDPRHFRALFNLGVVYESGLKDPVRAIATWQELLKLNPQNPDRNRVESLIQSARLQEDVSKMAR